MNTDLIKSRLTCTDYAAQHGLPITKSGDRCRSPLRSDADNPSSFVVYDDYWYDFGDARGGDVIDLCAFLEHNGDRGAAIRQLASATGVDDTHEYERWLSVTRTNDETIDRWHSALTDTDRSYLHSRRVSDETAEALKLGHTDEGRLCIPYMKNNHVVAWTSRAMQLGQEPKYLKSTNTDLTDRSVPWGLHTLHLDSDYLTIAEGAFDAISFYQEGYPVLATMGSGFSADQLQTVRALARNYKYLLLAFDSDGPGKSFTLKLGKYLFKHRISFKVATIPGDYKDISEYYAAGGDLNDLHITDGVYAMMTLFDSMDDFTDFIRDASRFMQKPDIVTAFKFYRQTHPEADPDYLKELEKLCKQPPTEDYIAAKVEARHQLKYKSGVGFYRYNGRYWELLDEEAIHAIISTELGHYRRGVLLTNISKLLKADLRSDDTFDRSESISFQNGTLHLDTGDFTDHSPEDLCSFCLPYRYDPRLTAPDWVSFIESVSDYDIRRMSLLQEIAGYPLFSDNRLHACAFLLGNGSNGKSVYLDLLSQVYGESQVSNVEMSALNDNFQKITLRSSLINIATETDTDVSGTGTVFKQITAGDSITGCYKGKDFVKFKPRCKMIFACNDMPRTTDASYGMARRMLFINFVNTYTDDPDPSDSHQHKADRSLAQRLYTQLPGIFNWCYDGYKALKAQGQFTVTTEAEEVMQDFKELTNPLEVFLSDRPIDPTSFTSYEQLYSDYQSWCIANGYCKPLTRPTFVKRLNKMLSGQFTVNASKKIDGHILRGVKPLEVSVDFVSLALGHGNR